MDPSRLQLLNESELVGEASIEEQYDIEVECEVFHLLQGDWILEESDPPVRVSVRGRSVEYSDGRLNQELSRDARPCAPEAIEWVIGQDQLLVKLRSSFI
jgi:hypothetical protein